MIETLAKYQAIATASPLLFNPAVRVHRGSTSIATQSNSTVVYQEKMCEETAKTIPISTKIAASLLIRSCRRNTRTSSETLHTTSKSIRYSSTNVSVAL